MRPWKLDPRNQVPLALQFGATFIQEQPLPPTHLPPKSRLLLLYEEEPNREGHVDRSPPHVTDMQAATSHVHSGEVTDEAAAMWERHTKKYIYVYMQNTNGRRTRKPKKSQKLKSKTQMAKSNFDWINGKPLIKLCFTKVTRFYFWASNFLSKFNFLSLMEFSLSTHSVRWAKLFYKQ